MVEGPTSFGNGEFGFVDPLGVSWIFVGRIFIGGVMISDADEDKDTSSAFSSDSTSGLGFQVGDQVWVFRRAGNVASLN